MKSIAVFVKNLSSGGAEKQSVLLAKAISHDCDVHYIVLNGRKVHQKYMDMLKEDSSIHIVTFEGGHMSRFKRFIKYLKEHRIGYIFSYLTAANAYACFATIFHPMEVYTGLRNAELPFLKMQADKLMTNHFSELAISNSFSGKENFEKKGFRKEKIIVITNCFENIQPFKEKDVHSYPHIITVGRFVAQKDYETAIKAISELKKFNSQIHFDIVGYGELESSVRQWVRSYGIEDITSIYINPDNISELLAQADIYLSTSLFEGTSNSIMEAMNADLPVVCTNVGDNNRLVEDNKNGFLCKIRDFKELAVDIKKLLENPKLRSKMGFAGKKHLLEDYSIDKFRRSYMKLIDE